MLHYPTFIRQPALRLVPSPHHLYMFPIPGAHRGAKYHDRQVSLAALTHSELTTFAWVPRVDALLLVSWSWQKPWLVRCVPASALAIYHKLLQRSKLAISIISSFPASRDSPADRYFIELASEVISAPGALLWPMSRTRLCIKTMIVS